MSSQNKSGGWTRTEYSKSPFSGDTNRSVSRGHEFSSNNDALIALGLELGFQMIVYAQENQEEIIASKDWVVEGTKANAEKSKEWVVVGTKANAEKSKEWVVVGTKANTEVSKEWVVVGTKANTEVSKKWVIEGSKANMDKAKLYIKNLNPWK